METLSLVLLLMLAVLLSAVIDQIVPKISLPLIQIVMGVVIALLSSGSVNIELEPDLFLVLFIAPLLYVEAKNADKAVLWRNIRPILSLAIGLVVVTTIIIGFVLNALVPAISLAAAFALGAALGPTDAVAVTSLSKQVSIPGRQWGILKGELLLNDASGIVSFQFAIAAAATGAFSLLHAGLDFMIEFIGGLVVGVAIGYLANFILRRIRDLGIDNITFHVLYEICIPFVVYLVADAIHVSGIIAVVVTGLVNVIAPRTVSPAIARMNIVSSSVWQVISFTLNGIVFVLLGTQIPTAMYYTWQIDNIDNFTLIALVLLLTAVLLGVRFIWCVCMELVHTRRVNTKFTSQSLRNALIVTLCGAKGTITLSILFTIPVFLQTGARFPGRHLIIFLGCGVILCTLLIATFLVPLVAPKKEHQQSEIAARRNYYERLADILRNVIEELTAQQTRENRRATAIVIKIYQDRLAQTKDLINESDDPNTRLRLQAIEWEEEKTLSLIEAGSVDADIGYDYLGRLERMARLIKHNNSGSKYGGVLIRIRMCFHRLVALIWRNVPEKVQIERIEKMHGLQILVYQYVIDKLKGAVGDDAIPTEDASKLLLQYERELSAIRASSVSVTTTFKIVDEADDIRRVAYQIELEQIREMYEADLISRHDAKNMRDNVFLMQMDLEDKL